LNYISCGTLWRIFAGIFTGFSLYIINDAVRVSEAAMGGAGIRRIRRDKKRRKKRRIRRN
jgi:hypothetical protein